MKFLNKIFNYLIAFGLIAYGVFFYYKDKGLFKPKETAVQVTNFSSIDVDKKVNEYLQATSKKIVSDRFDQSKLVADALKDAKSIKEKPAPVPDIPYEAQFHKGQQVYIPPAPPKPLMKPEQGEILDKKEYARQFIENARKGGWDIELSEDLEVIRSTPIRKPSQEIDEVEILPSN